MKDQQLCEFPVHMVPQKIYVKAQVHFLTQSYN